MNLNTKNDECSGQIDVKAVTNGAMLYWTVYSECPTPKEYWAGNLDLEIESTSFFGVGNRWLPCTTISAKSATAHWRCWSSNKR